VIRPATWLLAEVCVLVGGCGRIGFDPGSPDGGTVPAPIARFLCDDDPLDGVADASGRGHVGTCTACPALVPAVDGAGYRFTGAELVEIAYAPDFDPVGGVSAAAWVRPASGGGCVIGHVYGTASDNAWQLCVDRFFVVFACVHGACTSATDPIPQAWRQVVLVADAATLRVWVGGLLVIERSANAFGDSGELVIGGDLDGGALVAPFAGIVDDVRVWNRALSADQVAVIVQP
jgi:hypothetical protein